MKLGFVVLAYNGSDYLRRCLCSLKKTIPPNSKVIVIDNGSTEKIESKDYSVLKTGKNLGYAAGMNFGVKEMMKEDVDVTVWINNDVVFSYGWFERLHRLMVAFPGDLISPDQVPVTIQMENVTAHPEIENFWNRWNKYADDISKRNKSMYQYGAWFFSPVVPRSLIDKVGLLDEEFGTTHEDCDYLLRVEKAGHKCWTCNDSVVYHYRGITTAMINKTEGDGYWHKARAHFEKKWNVVLGNAPCYRSIFWKDHSQNERVI